MLLSSVGSANSADSALRQGPKDNAFSAILAKETSDKSFIQQRQVPAAVSHFSEASSEKKTESADTANADTGSNIAADAADELLSSNLLQQIALTNSNKAISNDNSLAGANAKGISINEQGNNSDQDNAESDLLAELAELADAKAIAATDISQDGSEQTDAKPADTIKADSQLITSQLQTQSAKSDKVEASTSKTAEQLTKAEKLAAAAAISTKPVISNGPVTITDDAEPVIKLPEHADKIAGFADKQAKPADKQPTKADGTTTSDAESLTALTKATASADDSAKQVATAVTDAAKSDKAQANSSKTAFSATAANLASKADTKTDTKADAKFVAEAKGNQSQAQTGPDKLTTAAQHTDAAATASEKAPEKLADKVTPTNSAVTAARSEQGFSATLANAQATAMESRLATATNNLAPTTTHAEQLKQSINLMQQDAAGHMRQQVSLMLSQQIQKAEIRLDPAGLGMMQIKIDMQQDQATVQFTVQQHQAKELIEQQLPRLREMLQQQGIQLAEGQVQQQSQQQQRQLAQQQQQQNQQLAGESSNEEQLGMPIQVTVKHSDRLVDYYA
ncbi:hypothetical protein BI198_12405 [Rheinheimera salexigens]|uniref:Flagellar hook-length control protein-like C-terminal domain-containing protein n=2 Tax=Rheinheimera salexigens TaxID=1628148 RepID=A0A1E7Q7W3_9GAMM|nr:hypothetical protein BI198_12405 [Rheinheimera salexigens]